MTDTAERYLIARGTKNLTVFGGLIPEGCSSSDGDVIVAAGFAAAAQKRKHPERGRELGALLMDLMDEWDSAAKPRKPTEAAIKALAERFREDDARSMERHRAAGTQRPPQAKPETRAKSEALLWYARELRLLVLSLRTRGPVLARMHEWAAGHGIHEDDVPEALHYWLHRICTVCDGLGWRKVPDAPSLDKPCFACNNTGKKPVNDSQERLHRWMDACHKNAGRGLGAAVNG